MSYVADFRARVGIARAACRRGDKSEGRVCNALCDGRLLSRTSASSDDFGSPGALRERTGTIEAREGISRTAWERMAPGWAEVARGSGSLRAGRALANGSRR